MHTDLLEGDAVPDITDTLPERLQASEASRTADPAHGGAARDTGTVPLPPQQADTSAATAPTCVVAATTADALNALRTERRDKENPSCFLAWPRVFISFIGFFLSEL